MVSNELLICGIGNKLKKDDGLGPYIIDQLEKQHLPAYVKVIDMGISAFKTALFIGKYFRVIFVDAIKIGKQAGHVYRFQLDMKKILNSDSLNSMIMSLHESDLGNILKTAYSLGNYPREMIVIGCEPKSTSTGLGLSKEVMKSIDSIIDLIFTEIRTQDIK